MSERFNNNADFGRWLATHGSFQDGNCLEYQHDERGRHVSLVLAYVIFGTWEAHTQQISRVVRLEASEVANVTNSSEFIWHPEHCMEGVTLKTSPRIHFSLDVPGYLEIKSQQITASQLPDRVDTVAARLSERELSFTVLGRDLPTPSEWQQWFHQQGCRLEWRHYGGDAVDACNVPAAAYGGWFMQERSLLESTLGGLFLREAANSSAGGFHIHLQNTEAATSVWTALLNLLAHFDSIQVRCGNCSFDGASWRSHLAHHRTAPARKSRGL